MLYELAQWVRAGRDQKFVLYYALSRAAKTKALDRQRRVPSAVLLGLPNHYGPHPSIDSQMHTRSK